MFETDSCEVCEREFPYYLAKKCEECFKMLCPVCVFIYTKYSDLKCSDLPPKFLRRSGPPSHKMKVCFDCLEKLRRKEQERSAEEEQEKEYEEENEDYSDDDYEEYEGYDD